MTAYPPQHEPSLGSEGPTNDSRRIWLIIATAAAVVVCLLVSFLLVRAIFPGGEPAPTIPWSSVTPTIDAATQDQTPSPTPDEAGCEPGAEYVEDVTIPDDTVVQPGETFLKAWRVRNSGTCSWVEGYALHFIDGAQMGGPDSVPVPAAQPGEIAEVSISLNGPPEPGSHRGNWQLCASETTCFGPILYVQIVVGATPALGTSPTPSATATASSPAEPTATPTVGAAASPTPSASPLPPSPGASEWLVDGGKALGVQEVAWDTVLGSFEADEDEVYLSLYIIAISTGDNIATFNALEIKVIDGEGRAHETLILESKDPPFGLCTTGPEDTCEGWWTTTIPDRIEARQDLILSWEPSLFGTRLETPILQ